MAFLHVMRQITLLLCHISSTLKSRSFGTSHLFNIKIQKLWNTDMRAHQLLDSFFFQQDSSGLLSPYILESPRAWQVPFLPTLLWNEFLQ